MFMFIIKEHNSSIMCLYLQHRIIIKINHLLSILGAAFSEIYTKKCCVCYILYRNSKGVHVSIIYFLMRSKLEIYIF